MSALAAHPSLLLALMFLVAINLRTVSIGVAPVLPLIRADLALTYTQAGILFALPMALMGLGAEPGRRLVDRVGPWRALAASLVLLGLGGGLRALAPEYLTMLLLTAAFGLGIGLAQPSLPRLVSTWFPASRAFATGIYTSGLSGGAILGASLAAPLLGWMGPASWRGTCVVWAGLAGLGLLAWLLLGPRHAPGASARGVARAQAGERGQVAGQVPLLAPAGAAGQAGRQAAPPSPAGEVVRAASQAEPSPVAGVGEQAASQGQPPLPAAGSVAAPAVAAGSAPPDAPAGRSARPAARSAAPPPRAGWLAVLGDRTAWLITALFLLQSLAFYQLSGWLPSYYRELGLSLEAASLPLALFNASSLPAGLLATYFSDRQHRRRPYLAAGGALVVAGTVGLVLAPLQPTWLWVSLAGAGLGMVFALALALPTDLLDAQRAGSTVSLVLTVGYGGGLLAPLLAGALRDALGSFTLALVPTTAVGLAILLATAVLPETARGLGGAAGR